MADRQRSTNPADVVTHYTELIMQERVKIAEAMANISEYADKLRRVADDTERRLLTRD
jgi:hypothetical protein